MTYTTIHAYMFGTAGSGKSTFINTATWWENRRNFERKPHNDPPDVIHGDIGEYIVSQSLSLYVISYNEWTQILELPHIKSVFERIPGFLVLVDSAAPESLQEAKSILTKVRDYAETPRTIIANKQDLPNALSIAQLRDGLHLEADEVIVPCVATDKESATSALLSASIKLPGETSPQTIKEIMRRARSSVD